MFLIAQIIDLMGLRITGSALPRFQHKQTCCLRSLPLAFAPSGTLTERTLLAFRIHCKANHFHQDLASLL